MLEWLYNPLCVITCTLHFLSNLFTGEMFSACARSLAAVSRDLAHVLNISPVNRLENIVCLQNGNWIYCKYMQGTYTIGPIAYSPRKKTFKVVFTTWSNVGRPPRRKQKFLCYVEYFLMILYFSAFLTEKMIVIFECGKGLVTIECFLGCAKEAILIRCSYRYFIGLFRIETADLVKARTRKRIGHLRGGSWPL